MSTTWNPADKHSSITLSESNMRATIGTDTTGKSVRSTTSKNSGKWCFEVEVVALGSFYAYLGFMGATGNLALYVGSDAVGWGCNPKNAIMRHAGVSTNINASNMLNNDVFTVCADWDNGSLTIYRNGTWVDTRYTNLAGTLFAAVGLYTSHSLRGRFTAAAFTQPIPNGFYAWDAPLATYRVAGVTTDGALGVAGDVMVLNAATRQLITVVTAAGDGTYEYSVQAPAQPPAVYLIYLYPSRRAQAHGPVTPALVA